eukprot:TRINITY_DN450_c0_g1_i2.p1 TRINITY_DN450_c0_g1~~TRINITY_DN450_c0_g1_i2.p1  ORF type:complete len:235 (-),score=74.00 TRINITY_DN450_c0_g1_i2:326-1030(-)
MLNQEQTCSSKVDAEFQPACHTIAHEVGLHQVDNLLASPATTDHICAFLSQCDEAKDDIHSEILSRADSDVLVDTGTDAAAGAGLTDSLLLGALKGDGEKEDEIDGDEADETEAMRDNVSRKKTRGYGVRRGSISLLSKAAAADPTKAIAPKGKAEPKKNFGAGKFLSILQQRQLMQLQMQQQHLMQLQMMRMHLLSVMEQNREIKARMRHMKRHTPGNCDCCQACPAPPPTGN